MRIAFVSGNREHLPDPVVPIGLLYVMAATPQRHTKALCDLCFEDEPLARLRSFIAEFRPEVVAIGMRNLQNSDYTGTSSTLSYYEDIIRTIRDCSDATIVLGGGGFSVQPRELMERLRPDYAVAGEGERAFPRLLEALESGAHEPRAHGLVRRAGDLGQIGNLYRIVDGEVVVNPPDSEFIVLDDLRVPDRSVVDPRYYTDVRTDNLQTKRGCALRCDYCTYPTIEGKSVRKRSPAAVVDEMQLLASRPGVSHLFIVDSVFNIPPKHAKAICVEIIARGVQIPWTCYANPLGFDEELAELMAASGCYGMEVGADSGCDEILKKLHKGFDTAKLRSISELCTRHGLKDCHTFLLGTPGETLEHVHRTLDFIVEMNPFAAVLMAYKDDYEALDPAYAEERRALRGEVLELLRERRSHFPRWIIPALQTNFHTRLFRALRRQGCEGPLWQYIDAIPEPARPAPISAAE